VIAPRDSSIFCTGIRLVEVTVVSERGVGSCAPATAAKVRLAAVTTARGRDFT
jgi:hypothetical protein